MLVVIPAPLLARAPSILGPGALVAASALLAGTGTVALPHATWSTTDKSNITLSGGNLTATNTTAGGVRATGGLTGKVYWEFTLGTIAGIFTCVGFATSGASLTTVASTPSAAAVVYNDGKIYINGSNTGFFLGARSTGDVIGVAVDQTAKLCWFRVAPSGNWNGSGSANPATGVGGLDHSSAWAATMYPLFASHNTAGQSATGNFGASAFTGSVPSGFTAGC